MPARRWTWAIATSTPAWSAKRTATDATCMTRVLNGIVCPPTSGCPLPFHIAKVWKRLSCTELDSPSCRDASRATSQVAVIPSASIFLPATRVVPRTRGREAPVASAMPETQVRQTSIGAVKSVRKANRTEAMSSPQIAALSCAYAVHPRCWSRLV